MTTAGAKMTTSGSPLFDFSQDAPGEPIQVDVLPAHAEHIRPPSASQQGQQKKISGRLVRLLVEGDEEMTQLAGVQEALAAAFPEALQPLEQGFSPPNPQAGEGEHLVQQGVGTVGGVGSALPTDAGMPGLHVGRVDR